MTVQCNRWCFCLINPPSLAGDDAHLLHLSLRSDLPCLPPLIVRSVHNVQDVSKLKVQALAGQPWILCFIIIKQCPAKNMVSMVKTKPGLSNRLYTLLLCLSTCGKAREKAFKKMATNIETCWTVNVSYIIFLQNWHIGGQCIVSCTVCLLPNI